MVISVNTRLLLKDRLEGIGWFTHENLKRISQSHPEHTFLFLFDRPYSAEFIYGKNVRPVVVPPPSRHPVLWYAWFEISLPRVIRKEKADLYLGPDGYMPMNLGIPSLITIHDINFHHRPGDLPLASRLYYRRYFPRFARKADRITTVSNFSKKDLVDSYGVAPDKIDVVYNGVNETYSPLSREEAQKQRDGLTGGAQYFVFIGSMHPRKNLSGLMLAFDRFRTLYPQDFKLLIVGEKMFMTREIDRVYRSLKHRDDIHFCGRLSPIRLREVLGAAAGMTFLPLFEGFGIPLLEAMRCDVPILTSRVSSLPEIAGEAAIYANPLDTEEIARGMLQLASDRNNNDRLIRAGRVRAAEFSWDKTSERLWESICRTMDPC